MILVVGRSWSGPFLCAMKSAPVGGTVDDADHMPASSREIAGPKSFKNS
jgi:hypothetical protein